MKRSTHPSLYFSAYPLKAIKQEAPTERSPYLKAILTGKTRTLSEARTSPIINPYKYKGSPKPATVKNDKLSKETVVAEKDWYKNYE